MSLNYKGKTMGDLQPYKIVLVTQVDLEHERCEVKERGNNTTFFVSLHFATGSFFHFPKFGDEWVVTKIANAWQFYCKVSTQNTDYDALRDANPGDLILGASGDIKVTSDLIASNIQTTNLTTTSLVLPNITNTWNSDSYNVASTVGNIEPGALHLSGTSQNIATVVSTSRLQMITAGTYAVSFRVTNTDAISTGRALVQMQLTDGRYIRRNFFHDEDTGWLESTLPLEVNDTLMFLTYHAFGVTKAFTAKIDITKVR